MGVEMIGQLMMVMCRVRLLVVTTVMGVGVVRRRGGLMGMRLRVGVVGMGSDLIEIHEWKDQGKTQPQCSQVTFVVRPHVLQNSWDFNSSQLMRRNAA